MPGNDSYTKLLLHCNGVDESTTFTDDSASSHTITANGDAQIDTAQKKFGTGAILLDGTGDYLSIPDSSDWDFGSGDFTIDFWIRFNAFVTGYNGIFDQFANTRAWACSYHTSDGLYFNWSTNGSSVSGEPRAWTASLNTWYHIAIVRNGTVVKLFVDGTQLGSDVSIGTDIIYNSNVALFIGAYHTGDITTDGYINGWMDEIRISKGIARWTSNFTPYTSEYLGESSDEILSESESITLDDDWEILTNPEQQSISDIISLNDSWELQTNPDNISIPDNIVIDDTWELLTNPQILDIPLSSSYTPSIVQNSKYETSSNVTSVPFVLSGSPIPDNVLIVFIGYSSWSGSGGDKIITPPSSDWNLIDKAAYGNAGLAVYWYKIKPGDGTSFTFNLNLTADFLSAIIYEITDVNNDNPINQHSIITESSGITRNTSSLIPSVLNTLALSACATNEGTSDGVTCVSVSSGFTLDVLAESNFHSLFSSYKNSLTSDLITPITNGFTFSIDPTSSIASMLLLNADNGLTVALDDDWFVDLTGTFITKFNTKLYTKLQTIKTFFTDLRVTYDTIKKFNTKLYLKANVDTFYSTDLRVRYNPVTSLVPGLLDNFIVKLDGVELTDVDYNTLIINLNLNTAPSQTQFTLSRRHDDLDKKLDGSASVITAQNKIEVFDGTIKLFTGYISEIDADSTQDTVRVTAEDIRRKLSSLSMELEYGGEYFIDSNHNGIPDKDDPDTTVDQYKFPDYIYFSKNIGTAFNEVIASIGGLISGCDSLPFQGTFTPEYTKTYNDYVSLIDELLRQTANINWYIDENERLRFQVIGLGTTSTYVDLSEFNTMKPHLVVPIIWSVGGGGEVTARATEFGAVKTLNLASLNSQRGLYDLIIHDVHLNKIPTEYAQSYNIKCGKIIERKWFRKDFKGWMDSFVDFINGLDEKTTFGFQEWGNYPGYKWYVGTNVTNFGFAWQNDEWVIKPSNTVQWLDPKAPKTGNKNLPDITVGSGLPRKTIYLESYGVKTITTELGEAVRDYGYVVIWDNSFNAPRRVRVNEDSTWIVEKTEESYNRILFLTDLANFMLNQNNKPITTANVSMILDAYEYHNLSFKNLINLTNTIQPNIYNNNNGFPLNIENIRINCADRTVSLGLTNYGKTFYAKTESYTSNYKQPTQKWIMTKQPIRYFNN